MDSASRSRLAWTLVVFAALSGCEESAGGDATGGEGSGGSGGAQAIDGMVIDGVRHFHTCHGGVNQHDGLSFDVTADVGRDVTVEWHGWTIEDATLERRPMPAGTSEFRVDPGVVADVSVSVWIDEDCPLDGGWAEQPVRVLVALDGHEAELTGTSHYSLAWD